MVTRQQKIEFLKGLEKGNRNLHELSDESLLMFNEIGEDTGLFTLFPPGTLPKQLQNEKGIISRVEIDRYSEQHPKVEIVLFTRQPGYEAINE